MSSRFSDLPQYHRLIIGHGVVAALIFLLIVPSAIFIARFYYRNPRLALRLHIYLQILTVALITVVLILGWFAVGPERSLSNPHHGIGVALYTLVLVQFFGGALIHRIEKGKSRWKIPLKLMVSGPTTIVEHYTDMICSSTNGLVERLPCSVLHKSLLV